jgi:predicted AAA+ superfamily ATPase
MPIPRLYEPLLRRHLAQQRQMLFLTGPRQVGKTTLAKAMAGTYLNWDHPASRRQLLSGLELWEEEQAEAIAKDPARAVIALDEIHKYARWRNLLKGLFDAHEPFWKWIVTGSARLNVQRRTGDSLMGRQFTYNIHPLSVGELLDPGAPEAWPRPPQRPSRELLEGLWRFGGFPEPFTVGQESVARQWRDNRRTQLLELDLRDLTRLREFSLVEHLALLLEKRSATTLNYSHLAQDIGVAVATVRQWVQVLGDLHQGFMLRPHTRKVARSLAREPKWYARDWSGVEDAGQRFETLLAAHLLKAVDLWNDSGLGSYELRYLRDREHREVDFVVLRSGEPWALVEAKLSPGPLNPALARFQAALRAPLALQVAWQAPFAAVDAFSPGPPRHVSAAAFLSQLP